MTKQIRFHEFGGPEVLRLDTLDLPASGADEVVIGVKAIGLNWSEVLFRQNAYVDEPTLPSGLGNEAAGVVEAVGSAVQSLKPGDRVAVIPGSHQGRYPTYGERIVFPARYVVPIPDNLGFKEAAGAYVTYMTGYFPIYEMAKLEPGATMLITGASSGTGQAAIHLAKAGGITVIGTTRTTAKRDAILEAGADHVVVTEDEDLVERVSAITAGRGVDLVYDGVGGPLFERLGEVVAHRGWIVLYGVSGGSDLRFPVESQFIKSWRFHTYKVSEFTGSETLGLPRDNDATARAVAFINRGLEGGALKVRINRAFPLEQAAEAHRYLEAASHVGKIVLTV